MPKCDVCNNEASRSMSRNLGEGVTQTIWYCKHHNQFSKPPGLSAKSLGLKF